MNVTTRRAGITRWALLIGITLGLVVVLGLVGTVAYLAGLTGYAPLLLAYGPLAVIVGVVILARRDAPSLGFRWPTRRVPWVIVTLIVALPVSVFALSSGLSAGVLGVLGFALLALLVAFVEETLFRGILLRAFASRGAIVSVSVTSVAFAVAHTVTALSPDADGAAVARTVVFALLFGIAAAQLRLQSGSILPGIALHASFDFVGFSFVARGAVLTDMVSIALCAGLLVALAIWGRRMPRPA